MERNRTVSALYFILKQAPSKVRGNTQSLLISDQVSRKLSATPSRQWGIPIPRIWGTRTVQECISFLLSNGKLILASTGTDYSVEDTAERKDLAARNYRRVLWNNIIRRARRPEGWVPIDVSRWFWKRRIPVVREFSKWWGCTRREEIVCERGDALKPGTFHEYRILDQNSPRQRITDTCQIAIQVFFILKIKQVCQNLDACKI